MGRLRRTISLLLLAATVASIPLNTRSQGKDRQENRTKTFGKSVKETDKKPTAAGSAVSSATADDETIKIETNLVVSDVLVVNEKGNAVIGLRKDDFIVTDNGVAQELDLFSNGTGKPIPRSIVLIMDYSGSQAPFISQSVAAAKLLVDKMGLEDRMAIISDDVKLLIDFTGDRAALKKRLDSIASDSKDNKYGKSAQYTALLATLRELINVDDLRSIIIMQSDGDELRMLNGSENLPWPTQLPSGIDHRNYSFADIKETLERSRATLYNVIPGVRFIGLSPDDADQAAIDHARMIAAYVQKRFPNSKPIPIPEPKDKGLFKRTSGTMLLMQRALVELANASGGYTEFLQRPEDADEIYTRILKVIDNRYVLGFYPSEKSADGKPRSVKIEVKGHPEYVIMGRKTYLPRR